MWGVDISIFGEFDQKVNVGKRSIRYSAEALKSVVSELLQYGTKE